MQIQGIDNRYMLYGMLFALSNRIQTYGDSQIKDITLKQHFVLVVLNLFGTEAPTLKELADGIGCSYQNLKRMLVILEKKGYVTVLQDPDDKRKMRIVDTGKVKKMDSMNDQKSEQFMADVFCDIVEEDLKKAVEVLAKIDENVKRCIDRENV